MIQVIVIAKFAVTAWTQTHLLRKQSRLNTLGQLANSATPNIFFLFLIFSDTGMIFAPVSADSFAVFLFIFSIPFALIFPALIW
jgi:hypothetical protein